MVLGSIEDIQQDSIIPPLHSGGRDSVQVSEAVEKGKVVFKDSKVSWSSLVDW